MGFEKSTPQEAQNNLKQTEEAEPVEESVEKVVSGVREKLTSKIRHRTLKYKEYFGKLNQEEFDELLSFDFRTHLKENPPIEETFSPQEELSKLKNLPKKDRREALNVFKQRLATQRKAWGKCRRFIERSIEFNHDVPRNKLIDLVDNQFGSRYGFTGEQKQIAEQLIDGYYENRQKVLEMRRKQPDDFLLIKELTGVNLGKGGDVHVAVGPMTIDIDANGFNSGRLYERSENPVVGFKYSGFASTSIGNNPIYYTVTNQDRWIRWIRLVDYGDPSGKKTRRHEHEHQKNRLFQRVFEGQPGSTENGNLYRQYETEQDPDIKKTILEDYFRSERKKALEEAKDEITASLYDRSLPVLKLNLPDIFFKFKQEGGSYDYLACLRNYEQKKEDDLYQETAQRMLVQEYRITIEKAVEALSGLTKKGKYSEQEAVALLTDKSLSEWPKTVRRLLEQK